MKKTVAFFAFLLLLGLTARAQQYEIRVKIDGVRDSTLLLGYTYEDKRYVVDSAKADSKGNATFSKNKQLERGVYFVTTPDKSYFEVIIGDKQKFSVSTKRSNLFENLQFKGSPENQQFLDYQKYLRDQQRTGNAIKQRMQHNQYGQKDSVGIYQLQLKALDSAANAYAKALMEKNKDNILGTLLGGLVQVEVPKMDVPQGVANKDSMRQIMAYEYHRAHYFDSFNFADNGLIRTPFFKPRLDFFFQRMIAPVPDTIIRYADMVIERGRANADMFSYLTEYFFQYYQNSEYVGHDAVVLHLADKYYLSGLATWASNDYKKSIKERADRIRPNLVGNTAPELLLQTHDSTYISLLKTPAEYTIVAFYEPGCGHCMTEIPQLWKLYEKVRTHGVVVFAIYTQYKRSEWDKFLKEHPQYDWINAWDGIEGKDENGKPTTFSLGSNFRTLYDVYSTPTLYLLDKDKKIMAKRIGIDTLEKIFEEEFKKKGSN